MPMLIGKGYSYRHGANKDNFFVIHIAAVLTGAGVRISKIFPLFPIKMLKFLEEVKLGFIFTPVHFKIAKEKNLAKNLEKRPRAQF